MLVMAHKLLKIFMVKTRENNQLGSYVGVKRCLILSIHLRIQPRELECGRIPHFLQAILHMASLTLGNSLPNFYVRSWESIYHALVLGNNHILSSLLPLDLGISKEAPST
jgi:hypothetical protein